MRFSTASTSAPVFLLPFIFGNVVVAELLGCDAVGCPVGEFRTAQCKVGNATLRAVGITNFTTTIDTRPLTWTLGLQEFRQAGNDSQGNLALDRNFYLGTPPSFQLRGRTGCALFFEGIAPNLTTTNKENFTCSDALNKDCVSDLIVQAEASSQILSDSDFCNSLRGSLISKPPSTCKLVKGEWGTIVARTLTGDNALQKADQSQCRATTGQGYDISLIESQRQQPASREFKYLSPIENAITPVMTVFKEGNDTKAELTCLRLVESKANMTTEGESPKDSSAGINTVSMAGLAMVSMIIALVF